jgi:excisionase family DNA binding protein
MNDQPATRPDLRANRPMMTLTEVAEYLRVHKITIYRALKAGDNLGQLKIGRVWRFSREDVVRFADGEGGTIVKARAPRRAGPIALTTSFRHELLERRFTQ